MENAPGGQRLILHTEQMFDNGSIDRTRVRQYVYIVNLFAQISVYNSLFAPISLKYKTFIL